MLSAYNVVKKDSIMNKKQLFFTITLMVIAAFGLGTSFQRIVEKNKVRQRIQAERFVWKLIDQTSLGGVQAYVIANGNEQRLILKSELDTGEATLAASKPYQVTADTTLFWKTESGYLPLPKRATEK